MPAERVRAARARLRRRRVGRRLRAHGSCLGRYGTVVAFLLDALNAITGNLDSPGGAVFGRPPVALDDVGERVGLATYGKVRSRVGGFPDVIGSLPATLLPREIETPGDLQIRALFVSAGNPVLSVPDGEALERALGELDLLVSLDFYVNETNRHADYVLPATTLYEREDVPLAFLGFFTQPFIQVTEAVVPPPGRGAPGVGDHRRDLPPHRRGALTACRRCGGSRVLGVRISPRQLVDLLDPHRAARRPVRPAPLGTEPAQAARAPARARARRARRDRRARSQAADTAQARAAVPAGDRRRADADARRQRVGPRLPAAADRHARAALAQLVDAQRSAADARRAGCMRCACTPTTRPRPGSMTAGARGWSRSRARVEVPVRVTDEMTPGTVALPHGWGHRGGWQLANENAGVNVNLLASSDPDDLERLAGMAHLNGIPVRVTPVASRRRADRRRARAGAGLERRLRHRREDEHARSAFGGRDVEACR